MHLKYSKPNKQFYIFKRIEEVWKADGNYYPTD